MNIEDKVKAAVFECLYDHGAGKYKGRVSAEQRNNALLLVDLLVEECATAAEVFGVALEQVSTEQRRYAKTINFGLIYGMSSFGLAKSLGIETKAAAAYIDRYFQRYPGVRRYMDDTRAQAKAQGYVETVFGRRLYLPEINSPNGPRRAGAERAAINAPMHVWRGSPPLPSPRHSPPRQHRKEF